MMSPCRRPARNSMVRSRSHTGALPSRSMSARRVIGRAASSAWGGGRWPAACAALGARGGSEMALDGRNQLRADRGAALLVELADTGGARHVDLGHESANDVETDEQHPLCRQRRTDLACEPAIAVIQRTCDTAGARGEVDTMITACGDES